MKFLAITPDRSDRQELLALCKWQMRRQTRPLEHRIIDYPPESPMCDLTQRVRRAVTQARGEGFDYCIIVENDDYYPVDWLGNVMDILRDTPRVHLAGIPGTTYYNLSTRSWRAIGHGSNSSLFCTTIGTHIPDAAWPQDSVVSLDLHLWRRARRVHKLKGHFFDVERRPIGIKHGRGKVVTPSHDRHFRNKDPYFSQLKQKVDGEYFNRLMSVWEQLGDKDVSLSRKQRQLGSRHAPPLNRSISIRALQE